jgi:hypothetical protein
MQYKSECLKHLNPKSRPSKDGIVSYRLYWNGYVWGNNWRVLSEMKSEMRRLVREHGKATFKVIKIITVEEEIEIDLS